MDSVLCVITARGGSKRIPKKNIKDFCGKPIIVYSIETAIKSRLFNEIMVSTDSKEIADIATKHGANVPFLRSEKTSSDYATTEDVLLEVLEEYERINKHFDYICCIYPTAPFISSDNLVQGMKMMNEKKPAVVIPVVAFSFPPQRSMVIDSNGLAKYKYPQYTTTRSQDLEKWYHDAGQFYIYDTKILKEKKGIISDNFAPIVLPDICVQDIDTLEDWDVAESKYRYLSEKGIY